MSRGLGKLGYGLILATGFLIAFEGIVFLRWTFFGGPEPSLHDLQTGLGILIAIWAVSKIWSWFERREKRDNEIAARIRDIDTRIEALYKWGSLCLVDDVEDDDRHTHQELDDSTKSKIAEYKKNIEKGDSSQRYSLGVTYWNLAMTHYNAHDLNGYQKAVYWLHKAAEQDYDCENTLGDAYTKLQDYDKAMFWYRKSVERGGTLVCQAEDSVADMYAEGHGVSQNYAEAARWWARAAEHGWRWANYALGKLYAKGEEGVDKNEKEAYFHLYIASTATGEPGPQNFSAELREEIAKKLGKYAVSREQKRAEEWLAARKMK